MAVLKILGYDGGVMKGKIQIILQSGLDFLN